MLPLALKLLPIRISIEFKDVRFRYPTRPNQPVLRRLNWQVKPGQYVVFVGASGCGKAIRITLRERFYDPLVDEIYVDDTKISSFNIQRTPLPSIAYQSGANSLLRQRPREHSARY
jgi:ATP-binding cassette subfamily B (MDR/TAP) protein 1